MTDTHKEKLRKANTGNQYSKNKVPPNAKTLIIIDSISGFSVSCVSFMEACSLLKITHKVVRKYIKDGCIIIPIDLYNRKRRFAIS